MEEVYLRARYYQPAVGRFLTRDTYTGEEDEPESLHLYAYCENDGVNAWDPSGCYTQKKAIDVLNQYTKGSKKDKDIKAMIKNESTMGTDKNMNGKKDVMQIFNPKDPDVHILARFPKGYKKYIGDGYYAEGGGRYKLPKNGYGAVKKLYKEDEKTFVKKRVTPKLSICFGIRWLYYKTQLANGNVKKGIKNYNGGGDSEYVSKIKDTLINSKRKLVNKW